MAGYVDKAFYVDYGDGASTGYFAVPKWATGTVYAVGNVVRQNTAPSVGNERCFICVVAGTSHATTEPTWVVSRGAKTTDNTVTWMECSGIAALNGDLSNTLNWTNFKAALATPSIGNVITDAAGTHIFICTTAGSFGGSEPAWNTAAVGNTTADNTITWTYIGTSFAAWGAPHPRLTFCLASANSWVAGNTYSTVGSINVFVASEHVETKNTGTTLNGFGLQGFPARVMSVAKTPVPPTDTAAGATFTQTAANWVFSGTTYAEFYNMVWAETTSSGTPSFLNATGVFMYLKDCTIDVSGAGGSPRIDLSNSAGLQDLVLEGCLFKFPSAAGAGFTVSSAWGFVKMLKPTFSFGATMPTSLFAGMPNGFFCEAGDFSGFTGTNVVAVPGSVATPLSGVFKNCKFAAGVAFCSAVPGWPGQRIEFLNCSDSGNLRDEVWDNSGTLTTETTIVRTGGATDGTTSYSYKLVSSANCCWSNPFEALPLMIWNDVVGSSVTITVYGIWGGGAVPNNDDIWIDVAYKGDSASPLDYWSRGSKNNPLVSNTALASDASTWGGSTTAFKMQAVVTPQQKGFITIYPKVGAVSSTFYIDPKPVLS